MSTMNIVEEPKTTSLKRGRPRKHSPLTPTCAFPSLKKSRGRPPGTGKKQRLAALGSPGLHSNLVLSQDVSLLAFKGQTNTPAVGGEQDMGANKGDESGNDAGIASGELITVVRDKAGHKMPLLEVGDNIGLPTEAVDAWVIAEKHVIEEKEGLFRALLPLSTDKEKVEIDGFLLSKEYLPLYNQVREKHGLLASDSALVDPVLQGDTVKRLLQTIVEMNQSVGRVSDCCWRKWEQSLMSAENVNFNVAWLRNVLTIVKAQHEMSVKSVDAELDAAKAAKDAAMAIKDAAQNQLNIAQTALNDADDALRVLERKASELVGEPLADASLFLE
ncbi:hypothetical protein IFM89_020943 [Coptis chinensis]|uniref:Uncharacterized protein n=1 Tax=Coptis chinensis TaxID=261450 RepID=A0A835M8R7_9MAGN|nr:hypothetical protein IFM89_020943 [Coptis chinensis]